MGNTDGDFLRMPPSSATIRVLKAQKLRAGPYPIFELELGEVGGCFSSGSRKAVPLIGLGRPLANAGRYR